MQAASDLLRCWLLAVVVFWWAPKLPAQRMAVEGSRGMITSAHELASKAGLEILQKGGNAIDAAVATGLALSVTCPFAGNIGGGGFMLIHLADGRDIALDYREMAPAAATRDMYLDAAGEVLSGVGSSTVGWKASGVPGTIAGFALAQKKYGSGKVTWADVVEPARRLAAEGHPVSQWTAANLKSFAEFLGQFPESKAIREPSRDHAGKKLFWVVVVSRVGFVPSAFIA